VFNKECLLLCFTSVNTVCDVAVDVMLLIPNADSRLFPFWDLFSAGVD